MNHMNRVAAFVSCFLLSILSIDAAFTTLDQTNLQVIDSFTCKHLDILTQARVKVAIKHYNNLQTQCIVKVNNTMDHCISCMQECGEHVTIPSHNVQNSGSSLTKVLDNVLHDLVHDPVGHFVHGAVDVVKDLGHGVEHVVDEIAHGIHHIGHVFHHVFGKRSICDTKCSVWCDKVKSNDTRIVESNVCGSAYRNNIKELEVLVPKFEQLSSAIKTRGIVKKVEYDTGSLVSIGGMVKFNAVFLTINISGYTRRFKTGEPFQMMNTDTTTQHWAEEILNTFLS
ncbi:uncharacterized protein LOC143042705 [Mytilus galloprovincialis]|uniref:uncharacterized protein LOC143042705 n=1 Tax=Mytilus galloprovincialis TaxID=29158 RepID=UPI003F7C0B1E